ncbi:MAG TPA: hypothetical protein VJU77_01185 [Chthoniobacterales bacterium]|nr:hypothetical protein [Chthoniobacterales bacterium]
MSTSSLLFGLYYCFDRRSHYRQHCLHALAVEDDVTAIYSVRQLGKHQAISIL